MCLHKSRQSPPARAAGVMRKETMKYLALLLIFITTNAFSDELLNISSSPDFAITLENTSLVKLKIFQIRVESKQKEKWINSRSDIECTCGAKCKKSPIIIEPNEVKVFNWDKKDNLCNQVHSGIYRISIYGEEQSSQHTYKTLGTSKQFTYSALK